jgi:hypothetical protein
MLSRGQDSEYEHAGRLFVVDIAASLIRPLIAARGKKARARVPHANAGDDGRESCI